MTERQSQLATLSESLGVMPVVGDNKVEVIQDYDESISSIIRDINNAHTFVYLEYYVIVLDTATEPIFDALQAAVARGVDCRVMYDWYATRKYKSYKKMLDRLKSDGVQHQEMLKFRLPTKGYVRPDLRNHRKLVVIDGEFGYTGSQNLVRRDYHRKDDILYDELVIRVEGPVVAEIYAVFVTDWYAETAVLIDRKDYAVKSSPSYKPGNSMAQVLPSGPGYKDENNLKLFTALVYSAKEKITIVNPYFVPDDSLMSAITSASIRGVEVNMINSEAMDQWMVGHAQRSFYETLLKAGVKIHLYNAPALLHSRFITVDDSTSTIGSSNLDIRSFFLNLEVTVISYDDKVVEKLRKVERKYLKILDKLV